MSSALVCIPGVELLDEIGRGAQSAVYRARRQGRFYAVKIPLFGEAPTHAAQARRFFQEAVALARVRHRALPAVMEVGRTECLPYIIMELAAGVTLAERLRHGPLPERQVLELSVQLADALVAIHGSGLAHRSIRTANILFDSHTTAVRLVDFGFTGNPPVVTAGPNEALSRHAGALGEEGSQLADVRLDLRDLGCVLFECISGSIPFWAVDPEPLLERKAESRELPPHISRRFARVLKRLIGLDGEAPYADAAEPLRDLRALVERVDPQAPSQTLPAALGRPRARVPLLGRERELDRLRAASRASAAGRSQVVLVRGPAGAGKTRLIWGFVEELSSEGQRWLSAKCNPSLREPFGSVRQLIEAHVNDYDALRPAEKLRAISSFRALAGSAAPLLRVLSPRLASVFHDTGSVPRGDGAEQIFAEGLAEFLGRLLKEVSGTTIVVDDVQWLDPGSRQVLGRLADRANSRTLFLLSGRDDAPGFHAAERLLRALDPERVWELPLEALDEVQVGELIKAYLGQERLDVDLLQHVRGFSDGTPLSVLETLRSMLDGNALIPYWGEWKLDSVAVKRMGLPRGSMELLTRRIGELDATTIDVLSSAAVFGTSFSAELLGRACSLPVSRVSVILADARRAMLVESAPESGYRFAHDCAREALLARLESNALRRLHQNIAEAMDTSFGAGSPAGVVGSWDAWSLALEGFSAPASDGLENSPTEARALPSEEAIYALAWHYAEGQRERSRQRVFETCLSAGKLAFRSFDNELAQRFFSVAKQASASEAHDLDLELLNAETHLRTGALEPGLLALRSALGNFADPSARAYMLSRVAWAEMQLDTDRAWSAISQAFRALRVAPPGDSRLALLGSVGRWILRWPWRRAREASLDRRRRLEVLCALYYQAARLALATGRPRRLLQAALRCSQPAAELGVSGALSRSYLLRSFVLTALGLRRSGRRQLRAAERVARATHNPVVIASALQAHAVIAAWGGDMHDSLSAGAQSLDEYGQWRELGEYCATAYNQQQIEAVRGRNLDAWKWLERAINKLSKYEGPPMPLEFLELGVRAALSALGRERDAEVLISRLVDRSTRKPARGVAIVATWGCRVRVFTECARLDSEFEAVVQRFRTAHHGPENVQLEAGEYYVHVAHARVHACLRADAEELPAKLGLLKTAASELRKAARLRLLMAHACVIEAYVAHFSGKGKRAERLFLAAELCGQREAAPWVLYAVHRGRAHALKAAGSMEAARDQARLAEALAREHGAAYRVRWIRDEFMLSSRQAVEGELSSSPPESSYHSAGELLAAGGRGRQRGYLKSLVRIGQRTARELDLNAQVRVVLDELIEALRADRGFLLLSRKRLEEDGEIGPAPAEVQAASGARPNTFGNRALGAEEDLVLASARDAAGRELREGNGYDARVLDEILQFAAQDSADDGASPSRGRLACSSERASVTTPLVVRGGCIGFVYLDRSVRIGGFSENDALALSALSDQVPLVFELARSLRTREHVKETQQSTDKLDAIGRLAGGIAHDFNNMLSVILCASGQILNQGNSRRLEEDVKTIQSAAERARDLTRQLLAFSRGQYLNPEVLELNAEIGKLEPIFQRLLGERTRLELELELELCLVKADPAQIDQVLTNLVVNAGDAMALGGCLSIQTSNVVVGVGRSTKVASLAPGRYACIVVTDTGHGMDEATLTRAFEPFFTTKAERSGSGLGLATAYGIVTQSGGHIEIESQLGIGTTFRIYFPETEQRPVSLPARKLSERVPRGTETILLVDDEPLVRESTRRMLKSLGYSVITAANSEDALRVASERLSSIDLVITDVVMPGMNGLELARELSRLSPGVRVLFVSGYTHGVLAERGVLRESVDFLQKPITAEALASRLRALLKEPAEQRRS